MIEPWINCPECNIGPGEDHKTYCSKFGRQFRKASANPIVSNAPLDPRVVKNREETRLRELEEEPERRATSTLPDK